MSSSFEASFNDTQDSFEKAGRVIITVVVVSSIVFGIAFVINLIIHVIRFIIAWKDGVLFSAPYGSLWNEREYPMVPMGVKQSYQRVVDDQRESTSCSSTSTRDSQLERGGNVDQFLINFNKEKPVRFSAEQLNSFTQGYSHRVGRGGFSDVYKGELPNGEEIVVKLMNYDSVTIVEKQFIAEVGTIGMTYHINLIRLYGFCFTSDTKALVYEYMKNGSLEQFLFGKRRGEIGWDKLHPIAIGTAKAIAYLHEDCQQRIIHSDIKPENILLDSNFTPKVADLGIARMTDRNNAGSLTADGCTQRYAAPEVRESGRMSHKSDVYSFGMTLFEIIGQRNNWDRLLKGTDQEYLPRWAYKMSEQNRLPEMIYALNIPTIYQRVAIKAIYVALWCIQRMPEDRPMMSSVVKMLDGDVEIPAPANPFLDEIRKWAPNLSTVYSEDQSSVPSSSLT